MHNPACSAQQQQLLGGHICPVWVLLVDRGALADVLASTQETTKKARSHRSLTCIRVSHSFRGPWSPVVLRFRYRPPAGQGPWICSAVEHAQGCNPAILEVVFESRRRETPRKWAALRAGGRGWAGLGWCAFCCGLAASGSGSLRQRSVNIIPAEPHCGHHPNIAQLVER